MKLSCADFSWPLLPHRAALELIHLLDIDGVDIGLFGGRSHVRPEVVREDVARWAGLVEQRVIDAGLLVADLYFQPATDFTRMAVNHPDPKERTDGDGLFAVALDFGHRIGAPGITVLPGVAFPGQGPSEAIRTAAERLRPRVEACTDAEMVLSVEGHVGSNVDTPEKLAELVALTPGLRLTLDYTHFTFLGFSDAEIEPLQALARHFQVRGAARDRLQTPVGESSIDHLRMVAAMRRVGYDAWIGLEYVWQEWMDCNRNDNLSESILLRDQLRQALAG